MFKALPTFPEHVQGLLPKETLKELERPTTAQAQAYQWLLEDPFAETYTDARLLQRFALATLYFATNGDDWYNATNWVSYELHECEWWSGYGVSDALQDFEEALIEVFFNVYIMNGTSSACVSRDGTPTDVYKHVVLVSGGIGSTYILATCGDVYTQNLTKHLTLIMFLLYHSHSHEIDLQSALA